MTACGARGATFATIGDGRSTRCAASARARRDALAFGGVRIACESRVASGGAVTAASVVRSAGRLRCAVRAAYAFVRCVVAHLSGVVAHAVARSAAPIVRPACNVGRAARRAYAVTEDAVIAGTAIAFRVARARLDAAAVHTHFARRARDVGAGIRSAFASDAELPFFAHHTGAWVGGNARRVATVARSALRAAGIDRCALPIRAIAELPSWTAHACARDGKASRNATTVDARFVFRARDRRARIHQRHASRVAEGRGFARGVADAGIRLAKSSETYLPNRAEVVARARHHGGACVAGIQHRHGGIGRAVSHRRAIGKDAAVSPRLSVQRHARTRADKERGR